VREALINGQAIARRAARSLRWRAAFLSYTTCVMDGAVAKGSRAPRAWGRKCGRVRFPNITGGFSSFVGFDRTRGVGVVVLTNATSHGTLDVGNKLLASLR